MKSSATIILISCIFFMNATPSFAAPYEKRNDIQEKRIERGVSSGSLTKAEQKRLEKQQEHVEDVEDAAEADGTITKKERAHIVHAEDRASRTIALKEHNGRHR